MYHASLIFHIRKNRKCSCHLCKFSIVSFGIFSINHRRTNNCYRKVRITHFFDFFFCLQFTISIKSIWAWLCIFINHKRFQTCAFSIHNNTRHKHKLLTAIFFCFFTTVNCQIPVDLIVFLFHIIFCIYMGNSRQMQYTIIFTIINIFPGTIPTRYCFNIPVGCFVCHPTLKCTTNIACFSNNQYIFHLLPAFLSMVPVPPSTTPSCFNTLVIVLKKHLQSNKKLIFSTYSPSNFAFTSIGNSSLPLI